MNYNFTQKKCETLYFNWNKLQISGMDIKIYDQYLIHRVRMENLGKSDLGIKPVQFGLNSGLGMDYVIAPDLGILIGYEFEYSPRFFGTSVNRLLI